MSSELDDAQIKGIRKASSAALKRKFGSQPESEQHMFPPPTYDRKASNAFSDFSFNPSKSGTPDIAQNDLCPISSPENVPKTTRAASIWRPDFGFDGTSSPTERRGTIFQRSASIFHDSILSVRDKVRKSSLWDVYDKAKVRQAEIERKKWVQIAFQYTFYLLCISFVYFVIVGMPLWKGAVYWFYYVFKYKFNVQGSWAIVIGIAFL